MNFSSSTPATPPPSYFGALPQDPTQLSNQTLQIQAVANATNNAYGATPDPQTLSEALQANSGVQIAALANEGSPDFASVLSNSIAGATPGSVPLAANAVPGWVGAPKMSQQDWKSYWSNVQNSDEGKSWGSFGEIPIANVDYANMVRGGSKQEVSKWQNMLQQKGFLSSKNETGGVWDAATEQAFASFMIAKFLPDALYNPDSNKRAQTNLFLQSLGYDVSSVALSMGHDPTFKSQTVEDWLQTQGPNVQMRDSIGHFASTYGETTVPQEILDLKGGFFSSITDGISSILHAPGSLLGIIPGAGSVLQGGLNTIINPLDEILSGNVLSHPGQIEESSTQARGENLAANLTDAEKQALQPAIQQIQQSSGFLSALDAWSQFKNKILLTSMFWLEDAFKGDVENPFDAHSNIAQNANKYSDNVVAGIFGDQFAKDHSTLAAIGNFTINMVDDPTTWILPNIGELGLAQKLEAGGQQATTMEKLTNGLISHRAGTVRMSSVGPKSLMSAMRSGDFLQNIGEALTTPFTHAQSEVAKAIGDQTLSDHEVAAMLGGQDLSLHGDKIQQLRSMSEQDRLQYIKTTFPFADKFHETSFLANRNEYMKSIRPESLKGLAATKLGRLLHDLSGTHVYGPVNLDDVSGTAELIQTALNASWHSGVDSEGFRKQVTDVMNEITRAPSNEVRAEAVDKAEKLVEGNLTSNPDLLAKYKDREGILAAIKDFNLIGKDPHSPAANNQLYATLGDATGQDVGRELSTIYDHIDKITDPKIKAQQQGYLDIMHQSVVSAMENMSMLDPAKDAQKIADVKRQISDTVAHYDQLLGGANNKKPVAWFQNQKYQWKSWKYTPYDLVAIQHPVLRGTEWVQRKSRVDKLMNTWKSAVLSSPHSWVKMALGDESIRGAVNLLAHDPVQFTKYIGDVLRRKSVQQMPVPTTYDIHRLVQDLSPYDFGVVSPGDKGYTQNLGHMFNDMLPKSGHAQTWATSIQKQLDRKTTAPINWAGKGGVVSDLKKWVAGDSPEAESFRAMHKFGKSDDKAVEYWSWQLNNFYSGLTGPLRQGSDNLLHKAMLNGTLASKDVKELMKAHRHDSVFYLPHIAGRLPDKAGSGGFVHDMAQTLHHKFADHMIQTARSRVYWHKLEAEKVRMKKFYNGSNNRQRALPGHTQAETDQMIESEAQTRALNWTRRSTYQMTRSMMGNAVRTAFPFWGAVANMDRFWLRTAREAPQAIAPVLYTAAGATQIENNTGGLKFQVPFAANLMKMAGFTNGDTLTFDPFHTMFLTAEGVNGFMPGLGPIAMAPLKAYSQYVNPEFGTDLSNSAIGQAMGLSYLNANSAIQPWLEKLVDGASLATFGAAPLQGVPFIGTAPGYYDKQINQKLQQQEGEALTNGGPAPTVQTAAHDVGMGELAAAPLSAVAPVNAQPGNTREYSIQQALKQWDQAQTEGDRQAIMQSFPDVSPYLQYLDPSTNANQRSELLVQYPWIQPYTVGQTQSTDASNVQAAEPSAQAYDADLASGRIQHLTPDQYLTKINTYQENNQAWALYDNVQSQWQAYLQETGQATTAPQAVLWRMTNIDPAINQLAIDYPTWGATFAKQQSSTPEGLFEASLPISSVMATDVMPQNSWLETPATNLWRATMQYVSEAASAVRQIKLGGGSTTEQQQVTLQLSQQLNQLSKQDPTFAAQLSQFRFSKVEDLVNFEAESGGIGVPGSAYGQLVGR